MSTELFFIYDTHCPWSYATTRIVEAINKAYPEIQLNLWHCAHYEGDERISLETIKAVESDADIRFQDSYIKTLANDKNSFMAANLMSWLSQKVPHLTLPVLQAIQQQHFQKANEFTSEDDFSDILSEFKLSPPAKVFKHEKLAKDAEFIFNNILEFQEIIGTKAIPALLIAIDDKLVLLNHNLYLQAPESIVEAVEIELKNN